MKFLVVMYNEAKKQHKNNYISYEQYFSLLIWPFILLCNSYYSYRPFITEGFMSYFTTRELIFFLVTGHVCYICFWSMVETAWDLEYERYSGTLEVLFLSSANKLAVIYGRALSAVIQICWLYMVICIGYFLLIGEVNFSIILQSLLVFLVLCVSSVIWGGLLNTIFLFSRDATFLVNILDEPMVLFSGVRVPIEIMPIWVKLISSIYPLTHVLSFVRTLFNSQSNSLDIRQLAILSILLIMTVIATAKLVGLAERKNRLSGEFNFY